MPLQTRLVSSLIDLTTFVAFGTPHCTLYIDLEGENLGRHGTITLVTILVHPQKITRIIDISALGSSAFTTPSGDGRTLKSVLEDPSLPKCVWDVRNDADALWAHYQAKLSGFTDIQLLENASRPIGRGKERLSGLDNAIRFDASLGYGDRERWLQIKRDVRNAMSNGVFSKRPLDDKTYQYCVNDVEKLPGLQAVYMKRITRTWLEKAQGEMERRLTEARSPGYKPESPEKVYGPWCFESVSYNRFFDEFGFDDYCDGLGFADEDYWEEERLSSKDCWDDHWISD